MLKSRQFKMKLMMVLLVSLMTAVLLVGCGAASADNGTQNVAVAESVGDEKVQRITSEFSSGQYAPITVKQGVPVVWTISVTEKDLNGCNNPMIIPAYGIEKKLVPGDNTIEFTPNESGVIAYSCWMGMIRSTITVVGADGDAAAQPAETQTTPLPTLPGGSAPGGCCGTVPLALAETPISTPKPTTSPVSTQTPEPEEVYDPELDPGAGCCG